METTFTKEQEEEIDARVKAIIESLLVRGDEYFIPNGEQRLVSYTLFNDRLFRAEGSIIRLQAQVNHLADVEGWLKKALKLAKRAVKWFSRSSQ